VAAADGNGIPGIALSGGADATTHTDEGGQYSFAELDATKT
jgi:hypothetical protein